MKIEYTSNNSGGNWWLKDEDWKELERAGWKVKWIKDQNDRFYGGQERWLGALAKEASKNFKTVTEALQEFEKITGQNVSDEGCNCCGPPHTFSWKDGYCSGEGCLQYLFPNTKIPKNLREAIESNR